MRRELWIVGAAIALAGVRLGATAVDSDSGSTATDTDEHSTVLADPSTETQPVDDGSGSARMLTPFAPPIPASQRPTPLEPATRRDEESSPQLVDYDHATFFEASPRTAIATHYTAVRDTEFFGETHQFSASVTTLVDDPCRAPISAQLAGATPTQARSALADCLDRFETRAERLDAAVDTNLTTGWQTRPAHGDVWVAEIDTDVTRDGDTRTTHRTIVADPRPRPRGRRRRSDRPRRRGGPHPMRAQGHRAGCLRRRAALPRRRGRPRRAHALARRLDRDRAPSGRPS